MVHVVVVIVVVVVLAVIVGIIIVVVLAVVIGIITTCLLALSSFNFQHGALSGPSPGFLGQRIHFLRRCAMNLAAPAFPQQVPLSPLCIQHDPPSGRWQTSAGRWQLMMCYLAMQKEPAFPFRNILNSHNTNRPHNLGGSVNGNLEDPTVREVKKEGGGYVCRLNFANSFRVGDGRGLTVFSREPKPRPQDATDLACMGVFAMWCLRGPDDVHIIDSPWQHGHSAVQWIRNLARMLHEDDEYQAQALASLSREQKWQLWEVDQQLEGCGLFASRVGVGRIIPKEAESSTGQQVQVRPPQGRQESLVLGNPPLPPPRPQPRQLFDPEAVAKLDAALVKAVGIGWPKWITPGRGTSEPIRTEHDMGYHCLQEGARIDFYRGQASDDWDNEKWKSLYDILPGYQQKCSGWNPTSVNQRGNAMEVSVGLAYAVFTNGDYLADGHILRLPDGERSGPAW